MSYATKRELLSLGDKPPYDADVRINGKECHHVKLNLTIVKHTYLCRDCHQCQLRPVLLRRIPPVFVDTSRQTLERRLLRWSWNPVTFWQILRCEVPLFHFP